MKPHKHADILRALADGHEIQWKYSAGAGGWNELYSAVVMDSLVVANAGTEFRIKPEKKWYRVAEFQASGEKWLGLSTHVQLEEYTEPSSNFARWITDRIYYE